MEARIAGAAAVAARVAARRATRVEGRGFRMVMAIVRNGTDRLQGRMGRLLGRCGVRSAWVLLLGIAGVGAGLAQGPQGKLHAVEGFPLREDGLVLRRTVRAGEPFTVAGPQGVVVGEQQGTFEAWVLPVKLLSHFTIEAEVDGYPVPIDLNQVAREIEVRPDRTTIIYSHSAVTVRQTMFAPEGGGDGAASGKAATGKMMPDGTGAVVVFQVDAVKPVELTFRFAGEMREMWPKPGGGSPSAEWVERGASGFYVLHTDFDTLAGAVALPGAKPGIMAPYQERPQEHPLELKLHVDPKVDAGKMYPLLLAVGRTKEMATNESLERRMAELNDRLPEIYTEHAARYRAQEEELTSIQTPDAGLDADFAWAETSIGQLRAKAQPTVAMPAGEMGLVAGYYASGDSARPGFGWFFGRDALYTLYAVDSYGDFGLAKAELAFLLRRQRADGKMMHEYSQTAMDVDWGALPYEYAAADATPLFLTTLLDYVRASGDVGFLTAHKDAVLRAWRFETTHDADGDGIYDNGQGTGWVESWPPGMPLQEVYLALLDQQGSAAMGELAKLMGEGQLATDAAARAVRVKAAIEREYFSGQDEAYAFSWNKGVVDTTKTVFPAIAWWNEGAGYEAGLGHPAASLKRWASHDFATDWGARDVAESDPMYDAISYHQGSVWPLFTGWAAMAQYRAGRPLAGFQSAMQNADLTGAQDLGAVTELLSGAFFEPFGRSTSHQLWSSAMVVTPVLRGMFGIGVDATAGTVTVVPRLPGDWDVAEVRRLHVGASVVDVAYRRVGGEMVVELTAVSGAEVRLVGAGKDGRLRVPLPGVEVSMGHGLPEAGARTGQVKVIDEVWTGRGLRLELEGVGGTEVRLKVRKNAVGAKVVVEGARLDGDEVVVGFVGSGYGVKVVTLRW